MVDTMVVEAGWVVLQSRNAGLESLTTAYMLAG